MLNYSVAELRVKFFGGKRDYLKAVKELEQTIYNIA